MTKKRVFASAVLFLIAAATSVYIWIFYFHNKPAALLIESQPISQVYIDGEKVGVTPYEGEYDPKEVRIKLIPQSLEQAFVPYEVKIKLESGVKTIVRRKLGEIEGEGSGIIVSFEKTNVKETSVSVVTRPDAAQIFLDGSFVDVSPSKQLVDPGDHELKTDAEGYKETKITLQAIPRYDLTVVVELEKNELEQAQAEESEKANNSVKTVEILSTPVGYLRVRSDATVDSSEIGQAKPGEKYEFIEEDDSKEWYKIKYSEDEEGWVYVQYATISAKPNE